MIEIPEVAVRAGLSDPHFLVTRQVGKKLLPLLIEEISAATTSNTIVLDFNEVVLIDASFADEVLGELAVRRAKRKSSWGCLGLSNLTEDSRTNLSMALETRTIHDRNLRNCVFPLYTESNNIELIGKAEGHVLESFDLLRSRGTLSAREVADHLHLDIAAASTRLKTLFNLGLADRRETRDPQGKQFLYTWPW